MKKQLIIVLSLVMVLMLVAAGCGNSNSGNSGSNSKGKSSNTPDSSSQAKDEHALEPYKLTMVYPGSTPNDLKQVQEELNKYLTEKINATIELKPIDWGAWNDKTNLMFTSNEEFDIIFSANWVGYSDNVIKGQYVQLDELIETHGQGAKEVLGPDWLNGSKVNGHNYGLPTLKEFASTGGLLFRKDLLEKYKIDLNTINKVEDLEPVFQTIKDNELGVTPLLASNLQTLAGKLLNFHYDTLGSDSFGVLDPRSSELKVINMYETERYKEVITLMHRWYEMGFINKDAAGIKEDQMNNLMKAGKGFAYNAQLKPGKDAEMTTSLGVEVVQKEFVQPLTTTNEATGAMLSISRTSDNPERAMMFIDLLYTDQYLLNLLNYGIEGVHYVKQGDNVIDFAPGLTAQTSGYNIGAAWMFGNQMNTYLWTNEDPNKWDQFKAFNDSSIKSPALGFVFDPTNVKNEIAAVTNVKQQYDTALSIGQVDPEKYIPEYVEKLKAAGMDKIIAEKQKQLDAWAANK